MNQDDRNRMSALRRSIGFAVALLLLGGFVAGVSLGQ